MKIYFKQALLITLSALILTLTSCSSAGFFSTSSTICKKWQTDGIMMSTLDSCKTCVDEFGANNPQQIQGCALGLDASKFLTSP